MADADTERETSDRPTKKVKTESEEAEAIIAPASPPASTQPPPEQAALTPPPAVFTPAVLAQAMPVAPPLAMASLPAAVQVELEQLFSSGRCGSEELETCCMDSLKDFSEQTALEIVQKFASSDLNHVRSKTAFFIGILKRYRAMPGGQSASATPVYPPAAAAASPYPGVAAYQAAVGGYALPPPAMPPPSGGYMGMGMAGAQPGGDPEKDRALASIPASVRYKLDLLFMSGHVAKADLETCCIDSLRDFDEVTAGEIVDKFCEADFGRINNKTAFFIGILKRYRNSRATNVSAVGGAAGAPMGGGGGGSGGPQFQSGGVPKLEEALSTVSPAIRAKVDALFTSGVVRKDEIEACCIDSLRDFSDETAMDIIDKFSEADMNTVRNKTAFFIGVLKRFRGQAGRGVSKAAGGGGYESTGGGAASWNAANAYAVAMQQQSQLYAQYYQQHTTDTSAADTAAAAAAAAATTDPNALYQQQQAAYYAQYGQYYQQPQPQYDPNAYAQYYAQQQQQQQQQQQHPGAPPQ